MPRSCRRCCRSSACWQLEAAFQPSNGVQPRHADEALALAPGRRVARHRQSRRHRRPRCLCVAVERRWLRAGERLRPGARCYFCLERHGEAHEAYRQAQRIDPRDARTNLNLSYTLFQTGSYAEALNAIAAGLAADVRGQYRETLLQKQQQILASLSARAVAEQERMSRLPAGT
jgi:tetratricopeptide (TPR) repeat protein